MSGLALKQANIIVEKAFEKAREMEIKPLAVACCAYGAEQAGLRPDASA